MAKRLTESERRERRATIRAGLAAGKSEYEIAAEIGLSRSAVQKERRAMRAEGDLPPPTRAATNAVPVRATGSRAVGVVRGTSPGVNATLKTILPPPDHVGQWRRIDLDRDTWAKADPALLTSLLINVSPEASRAVWDYLRLLNAGHEIRAYRVGVTDTDVPDDRAQAALDVFLAKLEAWHGSFKVVAGRLFMGAITRGAFFAELVLDERGREPVDIATPDPAIVRFRREEHPERGEYWQPGQWQGGQWTSLDVPTIRYIPIDPEAGSPYGRPMLGPAIFPCVFLLGLMHDLRRVVAQQGYPRTDIVLKLEGLREVYQELNLADFETKLDELIAAIEQSYSRLEPDDAWVHTDTTEVNRASGAIDTSAMRGAGDLISAIERMCTRALKSMPLMMGGGDSVAETRANREWEIFGLGVTSLQQDCETLLGRLLELALQAQGLVARVEVRFAPVRSADALRDEQVQKLKLDNAIAAENAGYMDRDEASEYAVGHPAAGEEPDEETAEPETSDEDDIEAEPGENRLIDVIEATLRSRRLSITLGEDRAASDDATDGLEADVAFLDEARLRAAAETWEEAFKGEDVETLLDAQPVEEEGDDDAE